ncbi:MAG: hypothetical protein HYU59_03180 [Magnetospirillum gryphiswaldense]|nr:hypothetical protein [Magnetospirillum gryphiswaldense]
MPLDCASSATDSRTTLAPQVYRCRQCGQHIARHDALLPMGGDHEHVVFNPAGMIFRVWCFADAQGLRLVGAPSAEFTWFKGYAWQIALCAQCGTHLGWRFDGDTLPPRFYGLVRDRLIT